MLNNCAYTDEEIEAMRKRRFDRNMAVFYGDAEPDRAGDVLDIGISDAEWRRREAAKVDAALAELDALIDTTGDDQDCNTAQPSPAPAFDTRAVLSELMADLPEDEEEVTPRRIYDEPRMTPYDRARMAVDEADARLASVAAGSDEYHRAMSDKAKAKYNLKTELERATDDGWRKRRAIDEHRAGEGRSEYNASRRKRQRPNRMTTKADLEAMTPEQRAQHIKDQKADSANRARIAKKLKAEGMTGAALDEAVEAKVEEARARRIRKRSGGDSGGVV